MDQTRRFLAMTIAVNLTMATAFGWPLACKLLVGANAAALLGCVAVDVAKSVR